MDVISNDSVRYTGWYDAEEGGSPWLSLAVHKEACHSEVNFLWEGWGGAHQVKGKERWEHVFLGEREERSGKSM